MLKKRLFSAHSIKGWPYHVSAGGVVFRHHGNRRQYALLYRGKQWYGVESWHLPKGTLDNDEGLLETARREIAEESGLRGRLWGYLGGLHQPDRIVMGGISVNKITHYFLFEYIDGDGSKMDREHDRLDWLSPEEAKKALRAGPKREEEIINRAEVFLKRFKKPPRYV